MLQLKIAEPCHEKWDAMNATERGAYCQSCSKEVVDFSEMEDEEVLDYFIQKQGQSTCGKFKNSQLNRPLLYISPDVLLMKIPYWKKFLAALFICFSSLLTSCENNKPDAEKIIQVEQIPAKVDLIKSTETSPAYKTVNTPTYGDVFTLGITIPHPTPPVESKFSKWFNDSYCKDQDSLKSPIE